MEFFQSAAFWSGLAQICLINLILSGDNAVIIALASRNLPPKPRKLAILIGSGAAILLRVVLTLVAAYLLNFPYLQAIGGALLILIGIKLLTDEEGDEDMEASSNIATAVKTIVIADLIMSLDNVLAVAAIAKAAGGEHYMILVGLGLAISIPIIIGGSQLLVWVMNKFPFFVYIGAGLIGYAAGEMFVGDKRLGPILFGDAEAGTHGLMSHSLEWTIPAFCVLLVCGVGWWIRKRRVAAAEGNDFSQ